MKLLNCPVIGTRPASDFICAGSGIGGLIQDDLAAARAGIYFGDATARVKREWWYHRPSHLWFVIDRDTATDDIQHVELASPAPTDSDD